MKPAGKAALSTALVLGVALYAGAARSSSRTSTPGSRQTGGTPNARQASPTPNSLQPAPLPNAYYGGVVPAQPPAVATFTPTGSTVTVTEYGRDGVIRVASVPPRGQVFLPLEMQ